MFLKEVKFSEQFLGFCLIDYIQQWFLASGCHLKYHNITFNTSYDGGSADAIKSRL